MPHGTNHAGTRRAVSLLNGNENRRIGPRAHAGPRYHRLDLVNAAHIPNWNPHPLVSLVLPS
mgnify:CR=1 FL=1